MMHKKWHPAKYPVDVVLDTDTYNEVDDQFALAYLLLSNDRINLKAVLAAPFYDAKREFYNYKSESAREGMEKSYEEILRLLKLMGREDMNDKVFKGSEQFMTETNGPIDSPAARSLIDLAMQHSASDPLYVVGIASPTNIASAILLKPEIAKRIVVVWMGGASFDWDSCREFNLSQDPKASDVLFIPEVDLVQIPGMDVSSQFTVTPQQLKDNLLHKNALCDYLVKTVFDAMNDPEGTGDWSRILWDVCAAAYLTGDSLVLSRLEDKPVPGEQIYIFHNRSGKECYVYEICSDELRNDLFQKLQKA